MPMPQCANATLPLGFGYRGRRGAGRAHSQYAFFGARSTPKLLVNMYEDLIVLSDN